MRIQEYTYREVLKSDALSAASWLTSEAVHPHVYRVLKRKLMHHLTRCQKLPERMGQRHCLQNLASHCPNLKSPEIKWKLQNKSSNFFCSTSIRELVGWNNYNRAELGQFQYWLLKTRLARLDETALKNKVSICPMLWLLEKRRMEWSLND